MEVIIDVKSINQDRIVAESVNCVAYYYCNYPTMAPWCMEKNDTFKKE